MAQARFFRRQGEEAAVRVMQLEGAISDAEELLFNLRCECRELGELLRDLRRPPSLKRPPRLSKPDPVPVELSSFKCASSTSGGLVPPLCYRGASTQGGSVTSAAVSLPSTYSNVTARSSAISYGEGGATEQYLAAMRRSAGGGSSALSRPPSCLRLASEPPADEWARRRLDSEGSTASRASPPPRGDEVPGGPPSASAAGLSDAVEDDGDAADDYGAGADGAERERRRKLVYRLLSSVRALGSQGGGAPIESAELAAFDRASARRWLASRNWDDAAAFKAARLCLEWRTRAKPHLIRCEDIPTALEMAGSYFAGHARDGRLVVVTRAAKFFPARVSMEEHMLSIYHMMEHAIAAMGPGAEQMINIMDMSGMQMANHDTAKSNRAMEIHRNYYPERLSFAVICNVPGFFRLIWGGMKRMLDPGVVARTHVLKLEAAQNMLRKHIAPEVLEVAYGGTRTEPYPTHFDEWRAEQRRERLGAVGTPAWRAKREQRSPSMQLLLDQYGVPEGSAPAAPGTAQRKSSLRAPATVRCGMEAEVGSSASNA